MIARIAAAKAAAGVEAVTRDDNAQRLLVVRVGPAWTRLDPARRVELARSWHHLWRDAVPQGIVAVLDAETSRPVVNFDATGRPRIPGPQTGAPR